MLKALFYKEWLKTRWALFIVTGVLVLALIKMILEISYGIRFMGANAYWYQITIMGSMYYVDLLYLPFFAGLLVGVTQFVPEISESRLKLTLHLPMHENSILMYMVSYGTISLILVFILTYILFILISSGFFPAEIVYSAIVTTLPWFLAGMVSYLATATVFVEPIWPKRVLMILIFSLYIANLLDSDHYNEYAHSLIYLFIISLMFGITILYAGQRFRKGVLK